MTAEDTIASSYFHGTGALSAVSIAISGFRLREVAERHFGRGLLGDGIYITQSAVCAASYGQFVLRASLAAGTRILRLTGCYDFRKIDALRREFGSRILRPDFNKAIPSNKHLRVRELIELLNWHFAKGRPFWECPSTAAFRRLLHHAKYDAFGCAETDEGLVVFNPSRLTLVQTCERERPIPVEHATLVDWAVGEYRSMAKTVEQIDRDDTADCEWGRVRIAELADARQNLTRYCERHSIQVPNLPIATNPGESLRWSGQPDPWW